MIFSNLQLQVTKDQLVALGQSLKKLRDQAQSPIIGIQISAIESQLLDLSFQVEEYSALIAGDFSIPEKFDLDELPDILIKARIACGMTQLDLAQTAGLTFNQIQQYEDSSYSGAPSSLVRILSNVLSVDVSSATANNEIDTTGSG